MRPMYRQACSALVVLAWMAAPAAAQDSKSADARARADISREIEAEIQQHIELAARQIEHLVDDHLDDIIDEVHRAIDKHAGKIEIKVQNKAGVLAQRQAGEAARREAQRAREAERRRRQDVRSGQEYTEKLSKTLRLGKNGTFDLQNVSGDIVVTGGGGNDVRIDAVKRVRHPNESEARALLQAIDVRMEERNGNVEVRTDYPRRNWSGGVDFTVAVPRDGNVILRSVSGDVRVSNLNGDLRAETISGDLIATAVKRIRQAKTISGDLEITDTDADDVTASTVSGTLLARAIKGRSVDLQSISGDVRMTDVQSDRAYVKSISGSIDFSGQLARNGRYEFQSHSGDVRVSPLGSQGFSLEASTFSGDLRSDFPLTMQGNSPNRANWRGPNRPPLRGTFGDGGAVISLQSFSGSITIVKR